MNNFFIAFSLFPCIHCAIAVLQTEAPHAIPATPAITETTATATVLDNDLPFYGSGGYVDYRFEEYDQRPPTPKEIEEMFKSSAHECKQANALSSLNKSGSK